MVGMGGFSCNDFFIGSKLSMLLTSEGTNGVQNCSAQ